MSTGWTQPPGVGPRTRRNRIQPWLKPLEHRHEFLAIREVRGMIDYQVDQLAPPAEFPQGIVIVRLDQGAQIR